VAQGKNCRKGDGELVMIDVDIHPRCARVEQEEKEGRVVVETQFDKGLRRYPYSPPEDAA
jgi:hypothetical protein